MPMFTISNQKFSSFICIVPTIFCMAKYFLPLLFIVSIQTFHASGQNMSKTFTLVNACKETVWPGIITKGSDSPEGGFSLKPGEVIFKRYPSGWSGRIWGRTACNFDKNGSGKCVTGSCGTTLNCSIPSTPPNTIAEFTIGDLDYYDVSLVDGFNVPISIVPLGGKGDCGNAGCDRDLRDSCPDDVAVEYQHKVVACRSACDVYKNETYCCEEGNPAQGPCEIGKYSAGFKQACPAVSVREKTLVMTCAAPDYVVGFCATRNQTLCSYHGNRLVCSTSSYGVKALPQHWWIMGLLVSALFIFGIRF